MRFPSISEYVEAIKDASDNLATRSDLRPVLDEKGEPVMSSGNFAVVFKMKSHRTNKYYALKCFLRDQNSRNDSYKSIIQELSKYRSKYLVHLSYLDSELFVDSPLNDTIGSKDGCYPVLLMDWVDGKTLDSCVEDIISHHDEFELKNLCVSCRDLFLWLISKPFAHGDLKPENILVKKDYSLVLVDYDGLYVPSMKGSLARENGSPNFNHPLRTLQWFDKHIDDVAILIILISLIALSEDMSLQEQYGSAGRFLFTDCDLVDIDNSQVFEHLRGSDFFNRDRNRDSLLVALKKLCHSKKGCITKKEIHSFIENVQISIPTNVTELDLKNSVEGRWGEKYSWNYRRLLMGPPKVQILDSRFNFRIHYRDDPEKLLKRLKDAIQSRRNKLISFKINAKTIMICDRAFMEDHDLTSNMSLPSVIKYVGNKAFM